jgi:RHS repeat-associated protein
MRVIQERTTAPTVSYTRGTDVSGALEGAGGIGGLLARSTGCSSGNWTTHYCYHADGNGNITYPVDASQALAASYRYDPFASTISTSGGQAGANVYRLSSKEIHVNSGLYYYGCRFYDPNAQRWINRDPLGISGGLNFYEFARNAPSLLVDSFGLDSIPGQYWPMPSAPPPGPTDPNLQKAVDWLKKCHPELCGGNPRAVDIPGLDWLTGWQSHSIIPFLIIIDIPSHRDISDIVSSLAHECMHKSEGAFIALIDYYFNGDLHHNQIHSDSGQIGLQHDIDPEGKNCKCNGNHVGTQPAPLPDMHYFFP